MEVVEAIDLEALNDSEQEALSSTEVELDEPIAATVHDIILKVLLVVDELSGHPLREYQRPFAYRVLESLIIEDNETITALWSRQAGKALALDTAIPTPTGWTTQGALNDGDFVFGPDGKPVEVLAVRRAVAGRPCYRVTFDDGTSIVADAAHEWLLHDGAVVETEIMANWSQSYMPQINVAGPLQCVSTALPIQPYTLGVWLGDGRRQNSDITTADQEVIDGVVVDGFEVKHRPSYGRSAAAFSPRGLTTLLRREGLLENKWRGYEGYKHIPPEYLRASVEDRSALLRGLMDSDGHVTCRGAAEITTIYPRLRDDIVDLIRGLGFKVTCHEGLAKLNGRVIGPKWRIAFTPFADDDVVSIARKVERLKPVTDAYRRSEFHRVVAVEAVASVPTRCISVEGGVYLAGKGLTPTHNSETIADVVATAVIMLPRLAKLFPTLLGKFSEGLWVGCFAPTDDMSQTLYGRIVTRLTSERAAEILGDPEIDEKVEGRGRVIRLKKCGSVIRRHTAHPKAQIEGQTYHLAVIDECQAADDVVINKSVAPMMAATAGTMVMTGTPTYTKNCFYHQIQYNKRRQTKKNQRQNHFQADWKTVAKSYPLYGKFVKKELLRLGEDSDEFKLSYRLVWMLDKGMFATSDQLDRLGDVSMQAVPEHFRSPVVVGIDPARKQDSTVVTVVWVGWDHPNEDGTYQHRILNWLDLTGMDWESQYFKIVDFLSNYNVYAVGIDVGGLGDVVGSRLRALLPDTQFVDMKTDRGAQTKRWSHLKSLMERNMISWPAHSKTRRLKTWRKFRQQMEDAEMDFIGPHIIVAAPNERDAHDDYVDSLASACYITADLQLPEAECSNAPW